MTQLQTPPSTASPARRGIGSVDPGKLLAFTLAAYAILVGVVIGVQRLIKPRHQSADPVVMDDKTGMPEITQRLLPAGADRPVPEGMATLPKLTRVQATRSITLTTGDRVEPGRRGTIVGVPLMKHDQLCYQVQWDRMEFVPESEAPSDALEKVPPKYKAGDRVATVESIHNIYDATTPGLALGARGTVQEVDRVYEKDGLHYLVHFDGDRAWNISEQLLKPE